MPPNAKCLLTYIKTEICGCVIVSCAVDSIPINILAIGSSLPRKFDAARHGRKRARCLFRTLNLNCIAEVLVARESILQGARVLLLEDETLINLGIVELLQSFGCNVTGCETLRHAWKAVLNELPDVALLDVNLQAKQKSYELAEWLHERHTPIVFLTGDLPTHCRNSGATIRSVESHVTRTYCRSF